MSVSNGVSRETVEDVEDRPAGTSASSSLGEDTAETVYGALPPQSNQERIEQAENYDPSWALDEGPTITPYEDNIGRNIEYYSSHQYSSRHLELQSYHSRSRADIQQVLE